MEKLPQTAVYVCLVALVTLSQITWCVPASALTPDDGNPGGFDTSGFFQPDEGLDSPLLTPGLTELTGTPRDAATQRQDAFSAAPILDEEYESTEDTQPPITDTSPAVSTAGSRLGDSCKDGADCRQVAGSVCNTGRCLCQVNFYQHENACHKDPTIEIITPQAESKKCEMSSEELCVEWTLDGSLASEVNMSAGLLSVHGRWTRVVSEVTVVRNISGKVHYQGIVSGLKPGTVYALNLTAESVLWSVTTTKPEDYCTAPAPPTVTGHTSQTNSVNISLSGGPATPIYHLKLCLISKVESLLCSDTKTSASFALVEDLFPGGQYQLTVYTEFCDRNSTPYTQTIRTVPKITEILIDCKSDDCQTQGQVQWWIDNPSYADEFRVTGSNGLNQTVSAEQGAYTYRLDVEKLSPGRQYHYYVTAIVKTDTGILTDSFEDDYTTEPAPAVIVSHKIVNETSVSLTLSTRPPMDLPDPYLYILHYCPVDEGSSECKSTRKKVKTAKQTVMMLSELSPFGTYNISVQSAVFGEVIEELVSPISNSILLSLAPAPPTVTGHTSQTNSVNISLSSGAATPIYHLKLCLISKVESLLCSDTKTSASFALVEDLFPGGEYQLTVYTEFRDRNSTSYTQIIWTVPKVTEILIDCKSDDCQTQGQVQWWIENPSYADEFRVTGSNGLNQTVPAEQGAYTYHLDVEKLSPGMQYHYYVTAIVKTDTGILTASIEDDYTTEPAPAVIVSHKIVNETTVSLTLSTRPPMDLPDPYLYILLYCPVDEGSSECKSTRKKVKTAKQTVMMLSELRPFGTYNISVKSAVFGEVIEEKVSPISNLILLSLEPSISVETKEWSKASVGQTECHGLLPTTQACLQWTSSFDIASPVNITIDSSTVTGKAQSVAPPTGQEIKGVNLDKVTSLRPGLGYTFTVVITSGSWKTQNSSGLYYTYPSAPRVGNQSSADTTSVTLSLTKTSDSQAKEEYQVRLCDLTAKDCKDIWTGDNIQLESATSLKITGLASSKTYNVSVRSSITRGDNSKIISPSFSSTLIYTAPSSPYTGRTLSVTETSILLDWRVRDTLVEEFVVQLYDLLTPTDSRNITEPVHQPHDDTYVFNITGLKAGRTYHFTILSAIKFRDGYIQSSLATALNITSNTRPSPPTMFIPLDVAPTSFSFVFTNTSLADEYYVETKPAQDKIEYEIVAYGDRQQRVNMNGLTPGTQYQLTLTAQLGEWESIPYTVTMATNETAPGVPRGLSMPFINSTVLQVKWSSPASPNGRITGYRVSVWQLGWNSPTWTLRAAQVTEKTQFTGDTLPPGMCYSVSVAARNGAGIGKSTKNITQSTLETEPSPPNIIQSSTEAHAIHITWSPPSQHNGIIRNYTVSTRNSMDKIEERLCFVCCDCPQDVCPSEDVGTKPECTSPKKMTQHLPGYCDDTILYKVSDESLNAAVSKLHAYAHYNVIIEACTAGGCGQSHVSMDTMQDGPTAPLKVKAVADSSTSVALNWALPTDPNGVIQFYGIWYGSHSMSPQSFTALNTTSDATSWTVSNLQKWTKYEFYIRGFTTKFGNSSQIVSCTTLEDAPSSAPDQIFTEALNASSVQISWLPPKEPNGHILQYRVTLHSYTARDTWKTKVYVVEGSRSGTVIAGLQYWSEYGADVSASTKVGQGPRSNEFKFQTDEHAPTSPPENFVATAVNATAILLTWSPPTEPNGPITHYELSYTANQGAEDRHVHVSGDRLKWVLTGLKYWTQYTVTLAASTAKGTGPSSMDTQKTCQFVPTSPVRNLRVRSKTKQSILLAWDPPGSPNGVITQYTIKYSFLEHQPGSKVRVSASVTSPTGQLSYNLTGLESYWWYTVTLQAFTVVGPGKESSKEVTVQTAESVPGQLLSVKATPVNSTTIKLAWQPPSFPNGDIVGYTIVCNQSNVPMAVPAGRRSVVIGSLKIWTIYQCVLSARTKVGQGQAVTVTCRTKEAAPVRPDVSADQPLITAAHNVPLSDPHTQAAITLPMAFFTDHTRGDPLAWGIIVREASITDVSAYSLTYISGRVSCPECVTWEQYHDEGIRKPYRATPDTWSPTRLNFSQSADTRERRSVDRDPAYILGAEGRCADMSDTDFCNGYLKPGTQYRVKAYVCNLAGCTDTYYSKPISTEAYPAGTPSGVAGAVVAVLLVLVIIGILVFLKRTNRGPFRKRADTDTNIVVIEDVTDTSSEMEMVQRSRPVKLSELQSAVDFLKRSSNLGFAEEYRDLKELSPRHPHYAADMEANRSKNRYTNILPFDHSRVKLLPLDDDDGSDYINANYIPGYNSKREYIAAQGPLPGTKDDFWRMIWEQNVSLIVMVTKCMEGRGRMKCEQYWPRDEDPIYFGELIVQKRSESILPEYDIRILDIKLETEARTVKHYNLKTWPDFGRPDSSNSLLTFLRAVRKEFPPSEDSPPILVHCSAGVGRTGTYIAVDCLLQQIRDHQEVDVFGRVLEMREHRTHMVQTEDQYIYIHDCAVDAYKTLQTQGEENMGYKDEDEEESIYENMVGRSRV